MVLTPDPRRVNMAKISKNPMGNGVDVHGDVKDHPTTGKEQADSYINDAFTSLPEHKDVNRYDVQDVETKRTPSKRKKCCLNMKAWFQRVSSPCMVELHPLPDDPTPGERIRYAFLCPPHGPVGRILTLIVLLLLLWGVGIGIFEESMEPGGHNFALLALFVLAVSIGALLKVFHLPPLLGMLLAGVGARNIPGLREGVGERLDKETSSLIRHIALVVILTRAGLHMDPHSVKKVGIVVILLAVVPPVAEAFAAATAAYLLLDFTFTWGMLMGFVLSAVSPAVVVPSFLKLQEGGYGVTKGIPILGIAASSVNDAASITGFGIAIGITFASGDIVRTVLQGPIELLVAFSYGIIAGIFVWFIPSQKDRKLRLFRFLILFGGGLLAMFGTMAVGLSGAGALACLLFTCVGAYGWRREGEKAHHAVSGQFAVLWAVFQPLLFGLIGAEIDLSSLEGGAVGLLIAVLFCGVFVRILMSFAVVKGMNLRERIFMALAWIPKATVQAAIGPLALDKVHQMSHPSEKAEHDARQILTIAVLAILITAPLGAIWIAVTGPRLLTRLSPGQRKSLSLITAARKEGQEVDPEALRGLPKPPSVCSELNLMAQEEEIIQNVQSTFM